MTKWRVDTKKGVIESKKCEFRGNTFEIRRSNRKNCASKCLENKECTHFSWTSGRHCSLKSAGNVTLDNAVVSNDKKSSCGLVISKNNLKHP